jgi:hypothetical protein
VRDDALAPPAADDVRETDPLTRAEVPRTIEVLAQMALPCATSTALRQAFVQTTQRRFDDHPIALAHASHSAADLRDNAGDLVPEHGTSGWAVRR